METKIATYSEADSKLGEGGVLTGNRCITKTVLTSNYSNVDTELLKNYTNAQLIPLSSIVVAQTTDLPYTPIFCVPFTDGTAKDIISGTLPTAGYTKVGSEHQFTKGGRYNIIWNVPVDKGTFSIMYKYISKGSSRSFLFGTDTYYTKSTWMGTGGNGMGIWPNVENGGSLCGGNRQWPRGANTTLSGMWTDDYHVATFTYDFSKAEKSTNTSRPGLYTDTNYNAFNIYKDGILLTRSGNNTMVNGDGTILSYLTIGGGINSPTDEYTTAYVKDARIYDVCLTPEEVKTLVDICKQKA